MCLRTGVPGAQAEHEAPAADLVEGFGRLRGDPRIPMQRRQDPCADLHARRRGGDRAGQRDTFPPALGVVTGWAPKELVRRPDRVKPELLGSQREVADRRPTDGRAVNERVSHREHEPDFDGAHRISAVETARV